MAQHCTSPCSVSKIRGCTLQEWTTRCSLPLRRGVMWAPPCLPQDRGKDSELELETGDALMLRSRQVKRLLDGELAELRAQLVDLLEEGWIQHSTAGHAPRWSLHGIQMGLGASAKTTAASTRSHGQLWSPFHTLMRCSLGRGGRASSRRSIWPPATTSCSAACRSVEDKVSFAVWVARVERGSVWFERVLFVADARDDLDTCREAGLYGRLSEASACHLYHATPGQPSSNTLLCSRSIGASASGQVRAGLHGRWFGALTDARAASAGCGGGTRDLSVAATVAQALSQELQVQVRATRACRAVWGIAFRPQACQYPRKVQSIWEWASQTSDSEVTCFTGLANYYCSFVEGYAEVAAIQKAWVVQRQLRLVSRSPWHGHLNILCQAQGFLGILGNSGET